MKRILINWYYTRFDLTEYLLRFADEMEIIFLFKQVPETEPDYLKGKKNISIVYWGDFKTPYQLLRSVYPDIVVFADLEAFNQIALNIAARNKGITTYVLQHGIRGAYEVDEALSADEKSTPIQLNNTSFWSLRFLFSAIRPKNFSELPRFLRFVYARKSNELTVALYQYQFELRRADYYIEFSQANTDYHRKRDGVPEHRFIVVGNPLFDEMFTYLNNSSSKGIQGNYCLLIDCPFTEAVFYKDHGIGSTEKRKYLQRLAKWTQNNGYTLKVKLHPLSYKNTDLYIDPSIEYVKQADLKLLIAGAAVVFFIHFSSITPVVLPFKPCIYFHSSLHTHTILFQKLGLEPFPLFGFDEKNKDLLDRAKKVSLDVLQPFLFSTDGKAAERIKELFLSHS